MELKYCYWYFNNALSDKICDEILAYGKSKAEEKAIIGREDKPKVSEKDLSKIRNSNIVWLSEDWIYNEIHPFVKTANQNAGWNFQWDWSESCQFTKYGKINFMIGIEIVGKNLIINQEHLFMEK
jgi:PKHD-type hydroxylase